MAAKKKTKKAKTDSLSSKAIKFLESVDAGKIKKNPMKEKDDLIAEIKSDAIGNSYADYKADFAAIDAYSSDGMAEMFYDDFRKLFKAKLDGCRISAIINDGFKQIGKTSLTYTFGQKGKDKSATITKVEKYLTKATSEAETFFASIDTGE